MDITTLQAHLEALESRLEGALARAGRRRDALTLIAVTKTQPAATVALAHAVGLRDVGENRVEEFLEKRAGLPADLRWHMIGHIQTRKARQVATADFDLVHSVDSVKLAEELDRRRAAAGLPPLPILIQVNTSGEATKAGFEATTPDEREALAEILAGVVALPHLHVRGLMTMAPYLDEPEATRPVFQALRALQERLQTAVPDGDWHILSMGMTNDFHIAIEEGATHVRVGTALFGERLTPQG